MLNLDNPQFTRLATAARTRGARIVTFGADPAADVRLVDYSLKAHCSTLVVDVLGTRVTLKVGMPGAMWCRTCSPCWQR